MAGLSVTFPSNAVISGAGSGIGRAVSLRLAAEGVGVGLIDRDADGVERTAAEIRANGGRVETQVLDVRDLAAVSSAVRALADTLGGIEAAVSAAGIARMGAVHEMSEDDWDAVIGVNLKGTFSLARAAIPHMLKSGKGAFTAISSDAGFFGAQDFGAYCASKHGVVGLVKAMALDYGGLGIRSNAVCPGFVQTPMADQIFDGAPPSAIDAYRASVPMKRFARPEEVAAIVAHFSSSDASYSNGCVYLVDGGSSSGFLIEAS